ncbi:MAG TPA: archease [Tepidisphaeraceae bacterium]|nr:archease [Tepidisphaeraceae bacterium]
MFEVFEHTADVGLRVRAADLNTLFAEAGRALFSLIVENLDQVEPSTSIAVDLQAGNLEDLLCDWLAELLYTFDARRLVLCRFEVEVQGTSLHGQAFGQTLDESKHQLGREVKAITYHGLLVRPEPPGWMAEVIVDI